MKKCELYKLSLETLTWSIVFFVAFCAFNFLVVFHQYYFINLASTLDNNRIFDLFLWKSPCKNFNWVFWAFCLQML